MPRRNRNALAEDLAAITHKPLCAGCRANPAADGGYCLPCKGQLILSARNNATRR